MPEIVDNSSFVCGKIIVMARFGKDYDRDAAAGWEAAGGEGRHEFVGTGQIDVGRHI